MLCDIVLKQLNFSVFFSSGFTPRAPDSLVLDSVAPTLQRWYLHRAASTITVYMFFSEPITLGDASYIAVYRNRKTATGKVAQYGTEPWLLYINTNTNTNTSSNSTAAGLPKALKYDRFNRQLSFQLVNYCADPYAESSCLSSKQPWENLFAFLNQTGSAEVGYFLSLGAGTVEDMALTSNSLKEITERLQVLEGSPGKIEFSFLFINGH